MTKTRTACRDRQAGKSLLKCLSQKHNRITRVGFEPRPCCSQSQRFLITRPRCWQYKKKSEEIS